jgi:hypothetical protein
MRSIGSPWSLETDGLLVGGGDALYLAHRMRQSGLVDILASLHRTVWVGVNGGSMVMAPTIGEDFVRWTPPAGGDRALGLVGFAMFPHLDHEDLPDKFGGGRRKVGRQRAGAGVRDRRSDRDQSDRRHCRSRLRGALEAVRRLAPRGRLRRRPEERASAERGPFLGL